MIMKKINDVLMLLVSIMLISSCNSGNDRNTTFRTAAAITAAFTSGSWDISSFIKDNIEIKNKYAAYKFQFTPQNNILINDSSNSYTGHWSVIGVDGDDDMPAVDLEFILTIKSSVAFSQLADTWKIVERTKSKLLLSRISNDRKSIDSLKFEKIKPVTQ